jgi:hypothetical protein
MEQTMSHATAFPNPLRALRAPLLLTATAFALVGCAGTAPTEQMAVSQTLVESAVAAGAPEYAAVEMNSAREKFQQAELAMQEHNYSAAKKLAEQAEWDARVAERKAQAEKAERALQDAQIGVQELHQEGLRELRP